MSFPGTPCSNGLGSQTPVSGADSLSPEAAAAVAAVVGLRQQMQMAAAAQHHPDGSFNLPAHCANIHGNNGGSAGSIPMPKLGSPAASGQLGNNGGSGIPMPRLASPAIPGMSNNITHSLAGIPGLHIMQSMMSGQPSQSGVTISPAHGNSNSNIHNNNNNNNNSNNNNNNTSALMHSHHNAIAHHISSTTTLNSGSLNISRISSPTNSAHDLRMQSPDENQMHSPLDNMDQGGVNLAVGVSGMSYKPSRGYSSPRPEHLFQEDINDFVSSVAAAATPRSCPSRLNSFKEPVGGIKIEPMTECRGE